MIRFLGDILRISGHITLILGMYIGAMCLMWVLGSIHMTRLFIIMLPMVFVLFLILYERKMLDLITKPWIFRRKKEDVSKK